MRLRIFAGPNGSGKSTLKSVLKREWLGIYINPDDIELNIRSNSILNLYDFKIKTTHEEIDEFFISHPLTKKANLEDIKNITFEDNKIYFHNININSYIASILSDFIRRKLVDSSKSLSFESVMSSYDKIEFLKYAKNKGFRIYIYFIATDDPQINIQRVKNRVMQGGHNVSIEKIISRYYKSLDNLYDAVKVADRSFIFDNSGDNRIFLAEINNGKVTINADKVPIWFEKYFIRKALTHIKGS